MNRTMSQENHSISKIKARLRTKRREPVILEHYKAGISNISVEDQRVNILGFVDHMVMMATT